MFNTLYLPLDLVLHWIFEFHELPKHLILGFNGVYPKKMGKIINRGEEVHAFPKRIGGQPHMSLCSMN